jgi:hypothetical protein
MRVIINTIRCVKVHLNLLNHIGEARVYYIGHNADFEIVEIQNATGICSGEALSDSQWAEVQQAICEHELEAAQAACEK